MNAFMIPVWVLFISGLIYSFRKSWMRRRMVDRLAVEQTANGVGSRSFDTPVIETRPWVAPLAGFAVWMILATFTRWPFTFTITLALVAGLLALQADDMRVTRIKSRIEVQLSEACDLMVGALQAGASVAKAFEQAAQSMKPPLKTPFLEISNRLKYGDDSREIFRSFSSKVPLECARIFSLALAVHWESGGRLVPLLSSIGRSIRDQVEIGRHSRVMSVEARISSFALIFITYFIAYVIWRADEHRMEAFLGSTLGSVIASVAILLQAVGIVWVSRMAQIRR